jgi:hypothetical protein
MNLDANPTLEELKAMLLACDDYAGDHILWVKRNGDVEITRVPRKQPPREFQQSHPEMLIHYEMFPAGKEYVGEAGADNVEWLNELFDNLRQEWLDARGKPDVVYIDVMSEIPMRRAACPF